MMDIEKLKAAAEKCTALNLDSAELERSDDGCIDCPVCGGEGYVDLEGDYCNIDDVALGVQFYGIGNYHKAAEEYFRIALPANIIALCDELALLRKYKTEADSQPIVGYLVRGNFFYSKEQAEESADHITQYHENCVADPVYIRPVPAGSCDTIKAQRDELLAALKYHQDQTRPIQAAIDLIAKCEAQS